MLAGVKFIPRDQVDKVENENLDAKRKKSRVWKEKHRRKKKSSSYDSSDDDLERIKKGSRISKKWYSSEEHSSSESEGDSEGSSERDERKYRSVKKKSKRSIDEGSGDEASGSSKKKSKSGRKRYSSEDDSSSDSDYEDRKRSKKDKRKRNKKRQDEEDIADDSSDDNKGSDSLKEKEIVRKEMGLEWMLRPAERTGRKPMMAVDKQPNEPLSEETPKMNPRELNPYLKDNGNGYPVDADGNKASGEQILSSSLVGDGGASWRLKALKRAQEQAAREG